MLRNFRYIFKNTKRRDQLLKVGANVKNRTLTKLNVNLMEFKHCARKTKVLAHQTINYGMTTLEKCLKI